MQREPAEVIGYDANAMTIKDLKSVLSEFGVALPVSTQPKRVYVDLLAQLQSRLIEASSKKAARRSRSMPRKIDFTVESFDSPKLRAVQMQHRSLQKQRMGRPRGMQLRNQRKAPDASRSIDDDDDEDDDNANDEGAGSSDDEDDADDLLVDSDDDDDVDEDDDDDDVVASVTPIASTPIRSGVDRDHGPTAASVFVDFVLFFCGAAAVVIGGGRLLDFAFGEKIFVLP